MASALALERSTSSRKKGKASLGGKKQHDQVYLTREIQNLYSENYKIALKEIKDQSQAGTEIARGNINNLRYEDDTTSMAESKEEPLDESERE